MPILQFFVHLYNCASINTPFCIGAPLPKCSRMHICAILKARVLLHSRLPFFEINYAINVIVIVACVALTLTISMSKLTFLLSFLA